MSSTVSSPPDLEPGSRSLVRQTLRSVGMAALRIAEIGSAILLGVELVILLSGVVSRYVLHNPLVWTDELASILFVWLGMFGAVVAHGHEEHLRMTSLLGRASPLWRARLDALISALVIVVICALLYPTWEQVVDEWVVTTPALLWPNSLRVAPIGLGFILMLVISISRLRDNSSWTQVVAGLAIVVAAAVGIWALSPWFVAMGNYNLLVFFVLIVGGLVFLGAPIAFCFAAGTLAYLNFATSMPVTIVLVRMEETMSDLLILSIPLFVVLGLFIELTGISRALINCMASLLGHVRGGLSYVLIAAIFLVSGISGSKAADMAAVAPALFPEMKRRGAKPGELVGLLAGSGVMSETIPPSLVLITMGAVTGISIAALFAGGIGPALFCSAVLAVAVWIRSRKEIVTAARQSIGTIVRSFVVAIPALSLPFVIRGAVVSGAATATEVATVGIAYSGVAGVLFYGGFRIRDLYPMLVRTASLSGAVLLIMGFATAMGWAVTQSGFSHQIVQVLANVPGGGASFLVVSIVAFIILGSVFEGIPAIILFAPMMFPTARALGINDIHYAMVIILSMGVGLFAPPFGLGFYTACAIGETPPTQASRDVVHYLLIMTIGVLLVAIFPIITTAFL